MPITVMAGLLFIVAALVLYSIGVWGSFRAKGATKRHILFMWLGFACDVLGTLMMAIKATDAVQAAVAADPSTYLAVLGLGTTSLILLNNLKTYLALVALAGMLAGIIFSKIALASGDAGKNARMSRVILAPWALWVVVFVMGLIDSAPKR